VRVQYAEEEAANAKAMLEESIVLLENETQIREQAEETIEGLEREMEWLEKKALKERADWERRMKDSLRFVGNLSVFTRLWDLRALEHTRFKVTFFEWIAVKWSLRLYCWRKYKRKSKTFLLRMMQC
jgi:hypothetical protein